MVEQASKYRITDRIDAGGMAEVFRGVAESIQGFKKNVAIKRILPQLCKNKKFIAMFLDEARLSLHLQHANIVAVFDIGQSPADGVNPGTYFIVMEFVEGSNLRSILDLYRRQGKRLRIPQAIYLTMEVCKGLAYAHDLTDPETGRPFGIVHRDISPPNILLSRNGEVKLVDFGLAKATSQIEDTDPGVVKGKFSYLSPEAASGRTVDRRTDIFAVGIILYEMITGKRLFYGETDYQTVELVRQARVPSLTAQNPEVDAELEGIIRRALARDETQRYQTAGEVHEALAHYLFSHGLKVTSRDLAQLVQEVVQDRRRTNELRPPAKSLIDQLITEEILKFTSLDSNAMPTPEQPSPGTSASEPTGAFIDTREWSDETQHDEAAREAAKARKLEDSPRVLHQGSPGQANAPAPPRIPSAAPSESRHLASVQTAGPSPVPTSVESPLPGGGEPAPKTRGSGGRWAIALVALLLIVGGGAVLFLMKSGLLSPR